MSSSSSSPSVGSTGPDQEASMSSDRSEDQDYEDVKAEEIK